MSGEAFPPMRPMFFRKSKLIQALREALASAIAARDAYREMAGRAIELAKEKHFPAQSKVDIRQLEAVFDDDGNYITTRPIANYQSPELKFCPDCNVSVRSEEWPQECPACHCLFGFKEK